MNKTYPYLWLTGPPWLEWLYFTKYQPKEPGPDSKQESYCYNSDLMYLFQRGKPGCRKTYSKNLSAASWKQK